MFLHGEDIFCINNQLHLLIFKHLAQYILILCRIKNNPAKFRFVGCYQILLFFAKNFGIMQVFNYHVKYKIPEV